MQVASPRLANSAPQLVTPQLPAGILGQPYAANVLIGSAVPISSATLSGLPNGLIASHNGSGSLAITGTPTQSGNFTLNVFASDSGNASLSTSITLRTYQVADNVAAIAAGYYYSCSVVNGGARCWGRNEGGQLGNNTTTEAPFPVQTILAGSGVTSIAVNSFGPHACAVVAGGVKCWGNNDFGQLGINSTQRSLVPVQTIPPASGVTAIAVGSLQSCAVMNGGLMCWGNDYFHGAGLVPTQKIAPGSGVTAVALGYDHACAIVSGGVQCWGSNTSYTLGDNTTTAQDNPVQTIVAGSGATSVAAGRYHTCAVVNGGVRCWGYNSNGSVGNNSTSPAKVPVQTIPDNGNVTAVAAGAQHSCAVANGGVQCWGTNDFGQLGIGGTAVTLVPVQTIAPGNGTIAVSAGWTHSCAVVNGGMVRCWGQRNRNDGTLGDNVANFQLRPTQIFPTASGITAGTAAYHSCIVVQGGVRCWGNNTAGQLGDNSFVSSSLPVMAISDGSGVTAIASGDYHTCAAINGGVNCWGSNGQGELGNNSLAGAIPAPVQTIALLSGATIVGGSHSYSCAVVNGGLSCWGSNTYQQLGNGSSNLSRIPITTLPAGSSVLAVATGSVALHTCALINTDLKCWGSNGAGQLGNGTNDNKDVPGMPVALGGVVTSVAMGQYHTCAVVNSGVKCWGYNGLGQLGNGTTSINVGSLTPVDVVFLASGASAVAAGNNHTCAIVRGGVYCWGNNNQSQLGVTGLALSSQPVPVIPEDSSVSAIFAGTNHTCAIVNGGLVCWGSNEFGQLADPVTAPGLNPVTALVLKAELTTTSISSNRTPSAIGDPIKIEAIVTSANGSPPGAVSVKESGNAIPGCSQIPLVAGKATCILTPSTPGVLSITATYSGAEGYEATISTLLQQTVLPQPIVPDAPMIVSATPGNGLAIIAFTRPDYDGHSSIASFMVTCGSNSAVGNVSPIVVTGLTNGTTYSCSMTATNAAGISMSSAPALATPSSAVLFALIGAQSRKTHGGFGEFGLPIDIFQPVSGNVTVESRNIGNGGHKIVLLFNGPVNSIASATIVEAGSAIQTPVPFVISSNEIVVTLSALQDGKRITLVIGAVNTSTNVEMSVGFLVGNVSGSHSIGASDVSSTKARTGQIVGIDNFLFDLNLSGVISAADLSSIKARFGNAI